MPRWWQRFGDFRREAMAEERLAETVRRLVDDGELSTATAERLNRTLSDSRDELQYVFGHLCAHLAIGVVFSFDLVPLPLGTMARGAWVAGSRLVETAQRRPTRAAVHSLPVFGVALIPFAGYFAYLIPLRSANADAAYVYANHIAYLRSGCSLERSLQQKPRWLERMLRRVLGPVLEKPADEETVPSQA